MESLARALRAGAVILCVTCAFVRNLQENRFAYIGYFAANIARYAVVSTVTGTPGARVPRPALSLGKKV